MTQLVDPDRKQRLGSIKAHLQRLRGEAAAVLWEYGWHLDEVRRDELWRDDGSASFDAWTQDFADMSGTTADRSITIARHFTREMAERFGSRKLVATVGYLDVTRKLEQPGDVQALSFRVQGPDGRWRSVPFLEAKATEIEAATALARASRRGRDAPEPPEPHVRERALALEKALPPAPKGTVRGDRVAVKRGKDGRMALTIKGIPLDDVESVLAAVKEHLGR